MELYLVKPDLHYYGAYNEMMTEWAESGTRILELMLGEAEKKHILRVLLGAHESNIGSIKVIEACGGKWENRVTIPGEAEPIRRYWIDNRSRAAMI